MSNSEKPIAGAPRLRPRDGQGPVPFKDAADVDAAPVRRPTEHGAAISAMPARFTGNTLRLRCYRGFWLSETVARGSLTMMDGGSGGFAARPGDVMLASLPKAGTTWLKALAFATMARGVWPPSRQDHPLRRLNPHDCVPYIEGELFAYGRGALLDELPSPRLMATHMPLSLLPSAIAAADGCCKIVYVCRDEKDRMVSWWHFIKHVLPDLSFSEVFESSCEGTCIYGPVWDHILEYWKASNTKPSNVLFMTYKNMLEDPCDAARKLAQFLRQPFSSAEEETGVITDIVELCSLENLRKQKVNMEGSQGVTVKFSNDLYFRKGVVGDWVNYMTSEMGERLDAILREKLDWSGLTV